MNEYEHLNNVKRFVKTNKKTKNEKIYLYSASQKNALYAVLALIWLAMAFKRSIFRDGTSVLKAEVLSSGLSCHLETTLTMH